LPVVTLGMVSPWSILEVKPLFFPGVRQQLSIFYFKTEKNTINLHSVMESFYILRSPTSAASTAGTAPIAVHVSSGIPCPVISR